MQSRYIDNICHLSLITPICVDVAWHNYSVLTLSWFQGWTSRMHPAVNVIRFDSLFFRASLFLFRCIFIASRLNYGAEWIFAWRGVPDLHCPFVCSLCSEQPSQNWSRQEESGCFIEAQCWPQKVLARCDFCPLLWMSKRLDPNSKQARVNDGICYDSLTGWMVLV